MEKLILTQEHWNAMQAHVISGAPFETCGLLAGKGDWVREIIRITNRAESPVRFRMDPADQLHAFAWMESNGLDLVGIYHSHPLGPEHPSETDIAEAAYPVVQVIWARAGAEWFARAFWIANSAASEVKLYVQESEQPLR